MCKANKVVIELLGSRRENKQKEYEYEVKYRDGSEGYLSIKVYTIIYMLYTLCLFVVSLPYCVYRI